MFQEKIYTYTCVYKRRKTNNYKHKTKHTIQKKHNMKHTLQKTLYKKAQYTQHTRLSLKKQYEQNTTQTTRH